MKFYPVCYCGHNYQVHDSDGCDCIGCYCTNYKSNNTYNKDKMDDDVEYCDCGIEFSKSGYCKFCGAHARYP